MPAKSAAVKKTTAKVTKAAPKKPVANKNIKVVAKKPVAKAPAKKAVAAKPVKKTAVKTVAKAAPKKPVAKAKVVALPAKKAAAKPAVKATAPHAKKAPLNKAAVQKAAAKPIAKQKAMPTKTSSKTKPSADVISLDEAVARVMNVVNKDAKDAKDVKSVSTVASAKVGKTATPAKPAKNDNTLDYKAGDMVVYPAHGVGQVEGVETLTIGGIEVTLYTITFAKDRMRLKLPLQKIKTSGLRPLSTKDQMQTALQTMRGRARIKRVMWSRRAQEYEAKINSGSPVQVAEVLRDLRRNATGAENSYSERQIFQAALERLASELAAIEKIGEADAAQKLQDVLTEAA